MLGPIEAVEDGAAIPLGPPRQRAVLAALVLARGRAVSVDRLVDAVWGEAPSATAPHALQVYVSSLRHALGADAIESSAGGYRLPAADRATDCRHFEEAVDDGLEALAGGDPARASKLLGAALALWRGVPALAELRDAAAARPEIRRLDELRETAREHRLEAELALGRHAEALGELESAVAEHPFSEALRGQLMLALYRCGRQADALAAYRAGREALVEELGVEPGPELQALERAILNHDASLVAPARAPSLTAPRAPDRLIGRGQDVERVRALLADARLVTLTGPGGIGKTRLALELADVVGRARVDGAAFVSLGAITDAALVPAAIARAVGADESGDESAADAVARRLRTSRLLLVLDNFEQVLAAAPAVARLLAACPGVAVLATTREPLGVAGEQIHVVEPLAQPDAVALLVERARSLGGERALGGEHAGAIADVCARLDGIPLALELAAARLLLLTPEELLTRLERRLDILRGGRADAPGRHASLRAALEASYALLDRREQRLFARLAVFAGGCSLDAAEAVCRPHELDLDPLDSFQSLVAKSLVRREERGAQTRLRLLETVREYALERLAVEAEEDELRDRHASHYLTVAESVELTASGTPGEFDQLDADHENFVSAVDWAESTGDDVLALRIVVALATLWGTRGYLGEARRRLDALLARVGEIPPTLQRQALDEAGYFALAQGDFDEARTLLDRSIASSRQSGDLRALGNTLPVAAWAHRECGDLVAAAALAEEGIEVARGAGDARALGLALLEAAQAARAWGRLDESRGLTEESLELAREQGHVWGIAFCLLRLGELVLLGGGPPDRAVATLGESRQLAAELGDVRLLADALAALGVAKLRLGEVGEARGLLAEGLARSRELGNGATEQRCRAALEELDAIGQGG